MHLWGNWPKRLIVFTKGKCNSHIVAKILPQMPEPYHLVVCVTCTSVYSFARWQWHLFHLGSEVLSLWKSEKIINHSCVLRTRKYPSREACYPLPKLGLIQVRISCREVLPCLLSRGMWEALVAAGSNWRAWGLSEEISWRANALSDKEGGQAVCPDWPGSLHNTLFSIRHTLAPRKESEQEKPCEISLDASRILKAATWNFRYSHPFPTKLRPYRVISYWGAATSLKPDWNLR